MLIHVAILIISFIVLITSAERLVYGASGIAAHYQWSPFMVGITLVALGTSAPEIMFAINAASKGFTEMAVGNAIGSNIANIGLVLGLCAIFKPIALREGFARREYPLLFLIMLFTYLLVIDGYLGVIDGSILILAFIGTLIYIVYRERSSSIQSQIVQKQQKVIAKIHNKWFYFLVFSLSLILLATSAHFLVISAANIAKDLGVSTLVVGLTIIAFGTSVPELATSLMATYKGHDDIAVGNILGSNIFNLVAVMSFPGIIRPAHLSQTVIWRDIPVMFVITLVLLSMNLMSSKNLSRWQGMFLLIIYFAYITGLVIDAVF